MSDIKANVGTKIAEADVQQDQVQDLKALPKAGDDVEGQALVRVLQICPWCGAAGWGWEDTRVYKIFRCHNCGNPFRA